MVERWFFYIKHRIKRFYNVPWKVSKVLWELVLTAEDAEGKKNILPEFTHPFEIQRQDTKACYLLMGGSMRVIKALWVHQR